MIVVLLNRAFLPTLNSIYCYLVTNALGRKKSSKINKCAACLLETLEYILITGATIVEAVTTGAWAPAEISLRFGCLAPTLIKNKVPSDPIS